MAQAPQKDIQAIIDAAAAKEGLDAELLHKIAGSESSYKANIKNPKSTAKGLFQFVDKTWREQGGKPGEQYIPEKNAELGARYVKQNQQALAQVLGRDPSYGEVYAAHVFGPTGAKALLTKADPNAPIEKSLALFESPKRVQKVLKQNPNLQGKTTAQVLEQLNAKMGSKKPQASAPAQEPVPTKQGPGFFRSPVPHFIRSEAPNLGTGYNAALALMGISDDELEKAQETVAQNEADNEVADFGQAKQMLTSIQAPSAFGKQQPRMLAEGGDVSKVDSAKDMLKEVGRSTQYLPADIAGSPVDLVNLGLKGVDAMTGSKLAQDMPVGGSEWIIQKAMEHGLMDKPTGSTTENVTRMAMGVVSPTAGPRAVAGAAKAVKGTAKAALEDLSMAATGQGGSKVAQGVAKVTGLEPTFASRPKGGVSLGASSAADAPLTRFDETLKQNLENIDTNTEQGQAVANFLDKKLRSYYQNQHGTADDPLYKAILENRIQPSIANARVIDQARAGDPEALKQLRRAYDASTNIQAYGSSAVLKQQGKHIFDMEGDVKKLIKQQSPGEDVLMASAEKLGPKELEAYPNIYGPKGFKDIVEEGEAGAMLRLLNKSDLQPHVRQAVARGEPIYGMTGSGSRMLPIGEMKDYLFTRTPAEIKNMGVVDVAVKAKQWHLKMAEARKNPEKFGRKELFSGTEPVLPLESGTWVDVKTPDALSLEGNIMGHCVGGSNYCNAVAQDSTKIISLRDKKGIPHVTIQLEKTPEGFTRVAQIKGTANNSPEKYFGEINAFLNDYSSKLGKNLTITERPSFVPPQWRDK